VHRHKRVLIQPRPRDGNVAGELCDRAPKRRRCLCSCGHPRRRLACANLNSARSGPALR
jgi:hypothetical protein